MERVTQSALAVRLSPAAMGVFHRPWSRLGASEQTPTRRRMSYSSSHSKIPEGMLFMLSVVLAIDEALAQKISALSHFHWNKQIIWMLISLYKLSPVLEANTIHEHKHTKTMRKNKQKWGRKKIQEQPSLVTRTDSRSCKEHKTKKKLAIVEVFLI